MRVVVGTRCGRVATTLAFAAAALLAGCSSGDDSTQDTRRQVTLSPPKAVRGAELEVTVMGVKGSPGAEFDLTLATSDGANEQGIGSGHVDGGGRLSMKFTMPSTLGEETQVEPGEYRLIFLGKDSQHQRFDHKVRVIAAKIGEKYIYVPTYGCLDYTRFDGRLWKLDGGELRVPANRSTFALNSHDRATYTAPDGKNATYRVADPASFDPVTFRCPT